MNYCKKAILAAAIAVGMPSFSADAIGWPANYEGVMLQGFYWDSWNVTGWSKLEAQSDELSESFKLIWVPNSAKAATNPGNGYDPVYWFTNHNTCWGTEAELRSMIATFKAKGTGIIEDVVINHRSGVSNWTDFPTETWNGQTWHIGLDGICRTDEVNSQPGQSHGTGAADTGDDFGSSRDLDHTNANVQNNCKNYCKFLLEDMGYAGFRYDMVKGYGGQYTKIYNQYSKPTYSVGEYWDANYDAVAGWINATGKESAAFDFPFKYAVNEAFSSGDMTKLVWKANGTTNQPAGMIHFGYSQFSVTFVDNHDTYRDGSKFTGNVLAANAFMLSSPGTPCVFWPHWSQYKTQIKAMIAARNAAGVHNNSKVTVLRSTNDCYMAEVQGSKGTLAVKVGSASVTPTGYSNSDIKASGNGYCIWVKTSGQGGGDDDDPVVTYPSKLYIIGNVNGWNTATSVASDSAVEGVYTWNDVDLQAAAKDTYSYFSFVTAQGSSWDVVNGSDRYGATAKDASISGSASIKLFAANVDASSANSWKVTAARYKVVADLRNMKVTITKTGESNGNEGGDDDDDDDTGDYPAKLYIIGDLNVWNTATSVAADSGNAGVYTWDNVNLKAADKQSYSYFSFVTAQGASWDIVNGSDRYGATAKDASLSGSATIKLFPANVTASSANAWKVVPGEYKVVADLRNMKVTITKAGGDNGDDDDNDLYPSALYIIGDLNDWSPATSLIYDHKDGGKYTWTAVSLKPAKNTNMSYFSFVTSQGATWDDVNATDRYGASSKDAELTDTADMRQFPANDNASSAYAWQIPAGSYKVEADLKNMKVTMTGISGVYVIEAGAVEAAPVYYNMQGVRVDSPRSGLYIVVRGDKVTKEVIR
ncbi:MAG: hypothetical protein K2L73_01130 [Muribaculaceae bacterium]|nr:hypothetical protein [Muribaculaceae bacterium]